MMVDVSIPYSCCQLYCCGCGCCCFTAAILISRLLGTDLTSVEYYLSYYAQRAQLRILTLACLQPDKPGNYAGLGSGEMGLGDWLRQPPKAEEGDQGNGLFIAGTSIALARREYLSSQAAKEKKSAKYSRTSRL